MDTVEERIKLAYSVLATAEDDFTRTFENTAPFCKHREEVSVPFRTKTRRGNKYYDWKCMLKYEPHVWSCTSSTCPFIAKGLHLRLGGIS